MITGEKIVNDWHLSWLREADYRSRALNIDANMRHDLARLLDEAIGITRREALEECLELIEMAPLKDHNLVLNKDYEDGIRSGMDRAVDLIRTLASGRPSGDFDRCSRCGDTLMADGTEEADWATMCPECDKEHWAELSGDQSDAL